MHSYEGLDRPGGFATAGMLAPLRQRDFRFLWSGLTVSLIGDGVFVVAVAWQAYELSGSPTALSMVMLAMTLPHVFLLLFGGVVSDRRDRRTVMLASDLVRGGALAAAGGMALTGTLTLGRLAAVTAVYGAGTAFFGPAYDAIVPDLLPRRMWPQANALEQLVKPLTLRMAGPALGGGLIALGGPGAAFLFDAATFLASACAIWAIRSRPRTHAHAASLKAELAEGLSYVRSQVWLWGTFASAAFAYLMFMGPVEVLLPFIVKEQMQRSAGQLGLVFTVGGIGSITAAVVMGIRGQPRRTITFIYVMWTLSTLTLVGYGAASTVWLLLIPSFLFNLLESAGTIVWSTLKQEHVPPHLLGRVSSLDWLISIGLLPISFALTGPVSALIGGRATLVGAGTLGAAVTFAALFLPGMRNLERARAPVPTRRNPCPSSPTGSGISAPEAARTDPQKAPADTRPAITPPRPSRTLSRPRP